MESRRVSVLEMESIDAALGCDSSKDKKGRYRGGGCYTHLLPGQTGIATEI